MHAASHAHAHAHLHAHTGTTTLASLDLTNYQSQGKSKTSFNAAGKYFGHFNRVGKKVQQGVQAGHAMENEKCFHSIFHNRCRFGRTTGPPVSETAWNEAVQILFADQLAGNDASLLEPTSLPGQGKEAPEAGKR